MKVALCNTKPTGRGTFLLDCFEMGLQENGDTAIRVNHYSSHDADIAKADVVVQVCTKNKHHANVGAARFRGGVLDASKRHSKRLITIDTAFLRNQTEAEMRVANKCDEVKKLAFDVQNPETYGEYMDDIYYEIGYGGIKANANYYNDNSPPDRWNALNTPLVPWRKSGDYILFLGQTPTGASSQHVDLSEWYGKSMKAIRAQTSRKVLFRQHPRIKKRPHRIKKDARNLEFWLNHPVDTTFSTSWLLDDDMRGAKVAVVFSSNASVRTAVSGIPTFVGDPICMAWDVGNEDFSKIENPEYPDREQWAHNLAYAQWNCAEMKSGEAWAHLRPHAESSS